MAKVSHNTMSIPFSYTNPTDRANNYKIPNRVCLDGEYFRKQYDTDSETVLTNNINRWNSRTSADAEDEREGVARDSHAHNCKLSRSNSTCCACFNGAEESRLNAVDVDYRNGRSDAQNGARGAHNMIASYGVYGHDGEESGFETTTGYYPEHVVVVTSQRDGTTTNSIISSNSDRACHWCWCRGAETRGTISAIDTPTWCKPAVLLLVLALLLGVFILVSGILVYFNYVTYKPRPPLLEEPCEKTFCAYGATCATGSDGKASCRCPSECPVAVAWVCGTDGKSYKNLCSLRMQSCRNKENTRVLHPGECDSTDPCRDKLCPVGARCVPSPDGRAATCVCPKYCPQYGDHSASRPVCGSDKNDYKDQCEMRKNACEKGVEISVKYQGACDPCENVQCAEPEVCQLDEERKPVCRCGEACSLEFTPVCGSDGKTYSNECILRQESCRARKNLRITYRGKCDSGVNPCNSVRCSHGEECVITKFGIARCECPGECQSVVRPVCGSNGETYDSVCHLDRAVCLKKTDIKVAYTGECGTSGPCSNHVCEQGAVCIEKGGLPTCVCPQCSAEFNPVCGSDGISYGNDCKLRLEACQHMRDITVLYNGLCNGCENKKCEFFSMCESDSQGETYCICPQSCPDLGSAVCGTDGETYKNDCELRKNACEKKLPLQVAYKGDCDLCQGVKCKQGARCEAGVCVCPTECMPNVDIPEEPVCASNMATYPSECEMQKQACLTDPPLSLTVLFYGDCKERFGPGQLTTPLTPGSIPQPPARTTDSPRHGNDACRDIRCDYDATCEVGPDHFPRCSCLFDCSHEETKLICGSDLRIYQSMCAMKKEGCERGKELRLRPLDLCQGMQVKPCNGESPVVDPTSGKELDCGNGPHRQDCPSDSYCHQTPQFARCCRKETGVYLKSCEDSWFGCCPDNKTPAQGADNAGCPSMCGCNKLGSYSDTCDPDTEKCQCKPGVGGDKCDRCEPGYWGLPKITSGHQGCLPCGCSLFGSVREDCEQMTGRCVCKPGVQGQKCTICAGPKQILGPNGCSSADLTTPAPTSCAELNCYFGAVCKESGGHARCDCTSSCSEDSSKPQQVVCGNDGQTFGSECQLKLYACRYQKDIAVQALGPCKEDMFVGTEWPVRRWTSGNRFTEPEDVSSPLSKSTRHLLVPDQRYYYNRFGEEVNNFITNGHTKGQFLIAGYRPTPATVQVYTDLLGDLCSVDLHCTIQNSICIAGACTCKEHYVETPDRQECLSNKPGLSPTTELLACSSNPCENGGACKDISRDEFLCTCLDGYGGPLCTDVLIPKTYEIPAFNGNSYVRLKRLKAYHKLTIEIEFKTYANDGILFYNQQHADGTGDFVSLAIVNGFVEFRYNLGNGPVVLTTIERIQMRKFHRVVAKRYQRDGLLQLDNSDAVAGQSQGTLKALDLLEDAYVGYVPTLVNKVFENLGTSTGLMGCIRRLKIGRRLVELHEGRDSMVEEVVGVKECGDNPCATLPCQNGATCHPIDTLKYKCACSPNFTGDVCEIRINPCVSNPCTFGSTCEPLPQGGFTCKCLPGRKGQACQHFDEDFTDFPIPEFFGDSYLEVPKLENVGRAFSLEVWFLSFAENGVLIYNGRSTDGRGDFISLNLVNSHVQFRFDLGSGIANITTEDKIRIGTWHSVRASRLDRDGTLQLDNGTIARGSSGASLNELNLELPLYIGGVVNITEVNREAGITSGLVGAIQQVLVNGHPWTRLGLDGYKVNRYQDGPCPPEENPCLNNGVCLPILNSFACKCTTGFSGVTCNKVSESTKNGEVPIRFDGNTILQYPKKLQNGHKSANISAPTNITNLVEDYWYEDEDIEEELEIEEEIEADEGDMYDEEDFEFFDERKGKRMNRYELSLRTKEENGLLLWTNKGKSLLGNFLAVAVVEGFPELSFNLGKQEDLVTVRSKVQLNDGEWHTLMVQRRKRIAQIQVDNEVPVKVQVNSGGAMLSTNAKLWIGGAANLPPGLPTGYYLNYVGCLQRLVVDKKAVNLLRLNSSLSTDSCFDV